MKTKVVSVRRDRERKNGVVLELEAYPHTMTIHLSANAVYRIARLARSRNGHSLFTPANGLFGRF